MAILVASHGTDLYVKSLLIERTRVQFFFRGGYQAPLELLELVQVAERCGFDGMTHPDHLCYPVRPSVPYLESDGEDGAPPFALDAGWPDVWVLFGALAAVTSRLRFRSAVYILPLRHPLVVARAVGTAAVISGNRVELGVGVGHQRDEFDAVGAPFDDRGSRTDEAIELLRTVLRSGAVEHHARWFDVGPVYFHPAPTQPVPIHVGGRSRRALRRAATLGDGYISFPHTREELAEIVAELSRLRRELRPDAPPLAIHATSSDAQSPSDYLALADIGIASVTVSPWDPYDPPAYRERGDALERFAEEVIVPVRARLGWDARG